MDLRGFPTSLPEFQRIFPNDQACASYLERLRWAGGFVCPKCGNSSEPYRFANKPTRFRCRSCKADTNLNAGTVMQDTRTPLSTWFWGAYLATTQTPGISAMQFQRQLGLTRYETAFQILHKLRAGMVNPERDSIGGEHIVEVDEAFVGGRTKGEGHGVHHKATVVGAVEVRARKEDEDRSAKSSRNTHEDGKPLKSQTYAGRLRLMVVPDRKAISLTSFVQSNVLEGSTIKTDGWEGYNGLTAMGYKHNALVLDKNPALIDQHLPMIHLIFSNLKTWLLGTHHGTSQQHLQAYLNEYVFRFNRRFYPMTAFNSVLGLASKTEAPTYAALYSGDWVHPA